MASAHPLRVEVELQLVGVRPCADGLDVSLAFDADPAFDELGAEDVALEEEVVVSGEGIEGLAEAGGQLADLAGALRRQGEDVVVYGAEAVF
jgi:hypothetical protein